MGKDVFRKGMILGIIFLFVGASVVPNVISENTILYETIYVDDDAVPPYDGSLEHPYQHIQDGIDKASDGDTIYVFNGIYYENVVIVNVSITLEGEDKTSTIIDGGDSYNNVIFIRGYTCTGTIITNFTIQNTNTNGIYIEYPDSLTIGNNIITNCYNGIELRCGHDHSIHYNIISHNYNGIYAYYVTDSLISFNHIENNQNCGVWIEVKDSINNKIEYNEIKNNKRGVFFYDAKKNVVSANNFISNSRDGYFFNGFNDWDKNYWDKNILKSPIWIIRGVLRPYKYPKIVIPVPQFDWSAAKHPHEIP